MKSASEIVIGDRRYEVPRSFGNDGLISVDHESWLDVLYRAALNLKEGAFIDVGANFGQSLFKLLRLDPSRTYVGFEPQPECTSRIQEFLTLNRLSNHQVFLLALSNYTGKAELLIRDKKFNPASSSVSSIVSGFRPSDFYESSMQVSAMPGDRILNDLKLKKIAMVKIDVEGAELEVVEGLRQTLQNHLPVIHFEVLNHFLIVSGSGLDDRTKSLREARAEKLEQALRSLGYVIYQVFRHGAIHRISKIKPRSVPTQSSANYFAVFKNDQREFTEQITAISERMAE